MSDIKKVPSEETSSTFQTNSIIMKVIASIEEGNVSEEKKIEKKFEDPSCCTATEYCRSSSFCKENCKSSIWCACCIGFVKLSWVAKVLIALFLSVSVITLEFAADTGFCYYNPVVPMIIEPISTARGECH